MRTRALIAVVAVAGTIGLAACGSDNSSSSSTVAPAAQAATTAAATSAAPATTAAPAGDTGGYGAYGGDATTAPAAATSATTVTVADTPLGKILADDQGHTLYVFTKDSGGTSACFDACAEAWPPSAVTGTPTAATGVSATLGTITRPDGTTQLTVNSQPLYRFAADAAAGDTTGQGSGGVWWVVAADGTPITS